MRLLDLLAVGVAVLAASFGLFAARRWRQVRDRIEAGVQAEARYRNLVERVPAVTYLWDAARPAGSAPAPYISPQIESMLGFTAEEWQADPRLWHKQAHPDDVDRVLADWERASADGTPFTAEYRLFAKDGRTVWVRDEASTVARDETGRPIYQGIMFDITERKRAELRLQEAESRYRTLVEQLPVVVYIDAVDDVSTALYVSPQYEHVLGFTREEREADAELWIRQLHPEDRDRVVAESLRTNATGDPFEAEYRMIAKDGRTIWIRDEATLLRDGEGNPLYWQGVMFDITERVLAAEALGRREAILESVGFAAERFLTSSSWEEGIEEVLEELGRAANASRCYIFQNRRTEDRELAQMMTHEWVAPGVVSVLHEPANHDRYRSSGLVRWERLLGAGAIVHGNVAGLLDAERRFLSAQGVASIVMVPLTVGADWWGYIGFDECTGEREWAAAEIEALKVAADTLGAAIGRARAAALLHEAEDRYRTLVEQIPAVTYIQGPVYGSGLSYISPQIEEVLGYTAEEWIEGHPQRWFRSLHPDDRDRVMAEDRRTDETGERFSIEYRQIAKDGRIVWVRDEAVILTGDDGERIGWQGVRLDITAAKEAEARLQQAEEKYRTLIERIPAIVYFAVFGEGAPWLYVSPQIESILGYTADEWIADPFLWMEVIHPDDIARALQEETRSRETGRSLVSEYRMIAKDGRIVWIRDEAEVVPDESGGPGLLRGMMYDITERKLAEERLQEAEAKYRTLVEQLPAAAYIDALDDEASSLYVSPQIRTIVGYTPAEWTSDPSFWADHVHPDDRERAIAANTRHNETGEPFNEEYRIIARDGRAVWVRDEAVQIRDEHGEGLFSQGILLDITEQKEAEELLRETETKYRTLVEQIPAVAYIDPVEGEPVAPTYIGPQIEALLGYSQEEWLADPELWINLLHPEDRERALSESDRSDASGEPYQFEYRLIARDGRVVWIHDEALQIRDEAGQPLFWQGILYDITERKLVEEALRESERREREAAERLRALDDMKNTFLAAVSHELRSPLTSILGLALTLEREDLPEEDRDDLLGRLAINARKLDRLLRDLLDIDRLNRGIVTPQCRSTDVGALIQDTVESLDVLADRSILVEVDHVVIPVDPAKVERIVENLLANAVRHTAEDIGIWVRAFAEGPGVLIAVEDDGPGVPKELWRDIFEPFRQGPTASPHAPGTGIGLSLVAMFAELHGGRAWVQDRDGGGASFRVFLPGSIPGGDAAPGGDDASGEEIANGTGGSRLSSAAG